MESQTFYETVHDVPVKRDFTDLMRHAHPDRVPIGLRYLRRLEGKA